MSGNRWRVKHEWYPFDEPHRVWEIQALVDGWWEVVCHRMTWQEAQNEADRLARTIQITLPRPTSHALFDAGNGYTTHFYQDMSGWIWPESDGRTFAITAHELEPIAMQLLAHHHRKANQ